MEIIILILLLLTHIFIIQKSGNILSKKYGIKGFKKSVFLFPLSIILTVIIVKLSGLAFFEAGMILGNIDKGLESIYLIGLPVAIFSASLVFAVPQKKLKEIKYGDKKNYYQIIYVWVIVGFVEEILYRGFVQGYLNKIVDGKLLFLSYATIISSLIFVLVHIINVYKKEETLNAFLNMIPTRLVVALVLGYSFQISNSIIYPIIIHNLIDGMNFTVLTYRKKKLKNQ